MSKPITCVAGDATTPLGGGVKVITHVCNDLGGWGKGFVLALSRRRPEPEAAHRVWHRQRAHNDFGLGAVQLVQVERYAWVANLVGQRGIRTGRSSGVPVRYEAIDTGLAALGDHALRLGASVHMPRIAPSRRSRRCRKGPATSDRGTRECRSEERRHRARATGGERANHRCGLAGGRWERVEPLVRARLADRGAAVTVYDR